MRIIHTTDPRPKDIPGQLALYNGMDTLSLYEILDGIRAELSPDQQHIYEFEMELQAALLEMEFNGAPVDQPKRTKLVREVTAERNQVTSILHQLCEAIGFYHYYKELAVKSYARATGLDPAELPRTWAEWLDLPIQLRKAWKQINPQALTTYQKALKDTDQQFNANSPDQKLVLFYHFFGHMGNSGDFNQESKIGQLFATQLPPWNKTRGIPTYKARKQDGNFGPSSDRACLEKIQKRAGTSTKDDAAYWAQPFISACLAIADYTKTLGFLNCKLEEGFFKSSFGAVTETGRLNSKANAQGYGWNAQNITPRLRIILTTPTGLKTGACDYEQIESRNVAAICFVLFGATAYMAATNCGDMHSLACSMVWDDLGWPADFQLDWTIKHGPFPKDMVKAAKKIAGQEFYRGKSRRDVSKTLGHGSNYLGQPVHMAKQSHIPLPLVEHYQDVYFAAFPEILQWHRWTTEQVQTKGEITTIFGRNRKFFGRPSDDATIREAVAYAPQSMAADYTNRALLALHKASLSGELPITLFLQKHDEIGFRFDPAQQDLIISRVLAIMEQHHELTSPSGEKKQWSVPAEALVGWNLGHRSDYANGEQLETPINPDGLLEYPDSRTRIENPFDITNIIL